MAYLRLIRKHDDAEHRFQADLHGRKMQEPDGRVHGMRQGVLARMKQRRGVH